MKVTQALPESGETLANNAPPHDLVEIAPEPIKEVLDEYVDPGETPEVVASTDMTADGHYGETWLMATNRRVVIVNPDHGKPELYHLWMADLEKVEKRDFVGNGMLRLITADSACEVRFSLAQSGKFSDVRDMLEALRRSGEGRDGEGRDGEGRNGEARNGRGRNGKPRTLTADVLRARAQARARRQGRCHKCGRTIPRWSSVCPDCLQRAQLLMRLVPYLLPYWFCVLTNLLLMFITTGVGLVPPYLSKMLLDDVFPNRDVRLLFMVLAGLLTMNLISSVLGSVRGYLTTWLQQRVVMGLRTQLYQYLHGLSLSFYDRQSTGHIIQRVMSDTSNLQSFIANSLVEIVQNVMTIFIIAAVLLHMDWKLALLTMGPVPIIAMSNRWFGEKVYRIYQRLWRQSARVSSLLTDTLPGVRVVKAFGQERREVEKFVEGNERMLATSLKAARMSRTFHPIMGFLSTLGTMSIWAYGGYLVISGGGRPGALTPGILLAFIQYLGRFYGPVHALCNMNERIQNVAASAERVFELIDTKPDVEDDPEAVDIPVIEGRVSFDNVSFGYETGKKVLEEVSFDVEPGEMIGLVGHSGAGKSTIINLVCRFYDAGDGTITIDGVDLRKIKLSSLRNQIGVVLQEPYLFRGTIADNISYGNPDATREEIIRAAIAANAHEFVCRLSDGYDTMIGERGSGLSGGERQRVSIARAILKNPRILILDEATASVDTQTEARIREAIDRLVKGRTTFAIAHRLSTLRSASRLIVMEKGQIVEVGTHEELLAKEGGVFKKLWDMQMESAKRHTEVLSV